MSQYCEQYNAGVDAREKQQSRLAPYSILAEKLYWYAGYDNIDYGLVKEELHEYEREIKSSH